MDSRLHQILIPVAGGPAQPVRRFNDATVQAAIDQTLQGLEADKHGVILNVDLGPEDGVRAVMAARLKGLWSIGMVGEFKSKSDWGAGLRVTKTFDW
jgi:hypothetical protein